jgi:hypothetical protein
MLVSRVKMATVFEEYSIEEQRSVVRFCGQMGSMQMMFINKLENYNMFQYLTEVENYKYLGFLQVRGVNYSKDKGL